MQEVREEQERRKAEGKTAMYKSLKKRRSRKRGRSSGTGITAEEDKKKDKNNEVGCPKGTDIAAEEYKKSNEQQSGIFPSNRPQMDPSSGSNTKVRPGKFRRQATPHHAPHNSVPPETHPSVSQGLPSKSEEKKGVLSKRKLCKTVRFQIDGQPEVLHPGVDDEEALDSLSVLRDENSCKLCFVFQPPMLKEHGLKLVFFFFSCWIWFVFNKQFNCKTPWNPDS